MRVKLATTAREPQTIATKHKTIASGHKVVAGKCCESIVRETQNTLIRRNAKKQQRTQKNKNKNTNAKPIAVRLETIASERRRFCEGNAKILQRNAKMLKVILLPKKKNKAKRK